MTDWVVLVGQRIAALEEENRRLRAKIDGIVHGLSRRQELGMLPPGFMENLGLVERTEENAKKEKDRDRGG